MFDFNQRPFLVIWETTHACDLACVHCRAQAEPMRDPHELNTVEAKKLIQDVRDIGSPILVFSGGDPLKRPDLLELIRFAKTLPIKVGVIPAVTSLLTREKIRELKDSGVDQIAFSLDADNAKDHDAFRRVDGVFERTLDAVRYSHEIGLHVQINSLVNVHNLEKLDGLIQLIQDLPIVFWEVFFLVPMGRGKDLQVLNPSDFDAAFERIYQLSRRRSFIIKVTEAPHYRVFYLRKEQLSPQTTTKQAPKGLLKMEGMGGGMGHAPLGVNSGKGFVFVSYKGDVYPSGFLPINAGNIRTDSLSKIYRETEIFKNLRDTSLLKGKCGRCEYKDICGGSRSRAFALTQDYLGEDAYCSYEPVAVS